MCFYMSCQKTYKFIGFLIVLLNLFRQQLSLSSQLPSGSSSWGSESAFAVHSSPWAYIFDAFLYIFINTCFTTPNPQRIINFWTQVCNLATEKNLTNPTVVQLTHKIIWKMNAPTAKYDENEHTHWKKKPDKPYSCSDNT